MALSKKVMEYNITKHMMRECLKNNNFLQLFKLMKKVNKMEAEGIRKNTSECPKCLDLYLDTHTCEPEKTVEDKLIEYRGI